MLHGDLYSRFLLDDGEVDLRVTVMFLTTRPFFSISTFLNSGSSFFLFDSFISIVVYSRDIFYWLGKSRSHISLYLRSAVVSSNHFRSRYFLLYYQSLFPYFF